MKHTLFPHCLPATLASLLGIVLVCKSCDNKVLQCGCLKHQKFIVSQFTRPEVQDEGAVRVDFW